MTISQYRLQLCRRTKARSLAMLAGALRPAQRMPYHELGGMRQRVAIAAMLASQAMIADEPTRRSIPRSRSRLSAF
jgi:ABC-type dipeptide/oligopeptide/nickel transport system ATPase component